MEVPRSGPRWLVPVGGANPVGSGTHRGRGSYDCHRHPRIRTFRSLTGHEPEHALKVLRSRAPQMYHWLIDGAFTLPLANQTPAVPCSQTCVGDRYVSSSAR